MATRYATSVSYQVLLRQPQTDLSAGLTRQGCREGSDAGPDLQHGLARAHGNFSDDPAPEPPAWPQLQDPARPNRAGTRETQTPQKGPDRAGEDQPDDEDRQERDDRRDDDSGQ